MISKTLFIKEIKSNGKILIIFMAVLTMYATMIVSMFDPELGKTLEEMSKSMSGIFAAFGMIDAGKTLFEFVANYLYGFLLICFPAVFVILLGNRLIGRYVDRGSMACLLSTPVSRTKVAVTQMLVMISSLIVLVLYVSGLVILCSQIMFPGELAIGKYIVLNVGLLGLLIFFGGICFCSSCMFNEAKYTYGLSAGLIICFILIQMLSQVGDKFEWLKYLTPLTLFAPKNFDILQGIILYIIGGILFVLGIEIFKKRDLPL